MLALSLVVTLSPPTSADLLSSSVATVSVHDSPRAAQRASAAPRSREVLRKLYHRWRERYLEPACGSGQQTRVHTDDGPHHTVSEGQGYGMLIAVMMGDRATFDRLYRYVQAHPSSLGSGLMAWSQNDRCRDVAGVDAATDGDLDIAYALLIASRRWQGSPPAGGAPRVNYRREATRVITALRGSAFFGPGQRLAYLPKLGDWVTSGTYARGTRTSDWMFDHFRAFDAFTRQRRPADRFWSRVLDHSYRALGALQRQHPRTGLLPDFAIKRKVNGRWAWRPAPTGWLEDKDGTYSYNACRDPWRIGTDAVINGEARARRAGDRLNDWARRESQGRPARLVDGYHLDGSPYGDFGALCFSSAFLVTAYDAATRPVNPTRARDRVWFRSLLEHVARARPQGYYNDAVALNAVLVVSGAYRTYPD